MDVVRKANNALYVGITAIFAWAITAHKAVVCILAYCVIIPVYYIVMDYNISTMKLGAYLLVFHNDKWEKRLHEINTKRVINRHASSYRNPFIYASVGVTVLFLCLLDFNKIKVLEFIQLFICIMLFICFNIYIFFQKDNDTIKEIYIKAWEKIKEEEQYYLFVYLRGTEMKNT